MKRKLKGILFPNVMLAILTLVLAFGGAAYLGGQVVNSYRTDLLMRECDALDAALLMYAKAHRHVAPSDVEIKQQSDGNSHMFYTTSSIFPQTLPELGSVRAQGYFSEAIDLSKFKYTTQMASDGSMTYTLEVELPNGEIYISPLSKK